MIRKMMRAAASAALGLCIALGLHAEQGRYVVNSGSGKVLVQFLEQGVVRVDFVNSESDALAETLMTVPGALKLAEADPKPGVKELSAEGVRVSYAEDPLSLVFMDDSGKILLRLADQGFQRSPDGAYSLTFHKESGDKFFGLGEPFANLEVLGGQGALTYLTKPVELDQNGRKVKIWNTHFPPPSKMGLPFFFNPAGYALLVDNPYRAEWDFSQALHFSYRAEGGPARFYVMTGTPYQIIDAYSRLTGRTPMPPRWATGYLQSRYGYASEPEFRSLMDNFRSRQIPCDVLIFDLDWYAHGNSQRQIRMGDLAWSQEHFPNALEFQKELDRRGFKAITIVEPQIWSSSDNYREVVDKGLVAREGSGKPYVFKHWGTSDSVLLDYLNPAAGKWFANKVREIRETGVDGWWTDLNEPEDDHLDMVFSGRPDNGAHNLQALLQHKAMAEMYAEQYPDERLFIMSRGGFVGDWRYGSGIWSGDVNSSWGHFRNQVPIGISAGLSGYGFWNSDTGGFNGKPSPEMFTRWMQFSAFCPVFRAHGSHQPREPWAFGKEAEQNIKKIMELRYRLSPYHYTTFFELHQSGKPPIRALFLEFPEDKQAYEVDSQYMYGPWLLVAPVTAAGAHSRRVYLPAGTWTDFWTEKTYQGPAKIIAQAPLDRIPLFVREGAVIPMGPLMQYMGEKPRDQITLHVYPGAGKSAYQIYDDDGASNDYLKGAYTLTPVLVNPGKELELKVGPRQGSFEGMSKNPSWVVVCHNSAKPSAVTLSGQPVAYRSQDVEEVLPDGPGWSHDSAKNLVKIYIPQGETLNLSLSP